MRKRTQTVIICLLSCTVLFSQKATLNGYITDKKTGERLFGASVFLIDKNLGTTSNNFGFYSITIPQDSVELSFSYSGYMPQIQKIALFSDTTLNIELIASRDLTEVVVKATRKEAIQNRTQMSNIELPISTIKSLPAF